MVLGNSHDIRMIVFRKSYSSYDTVDGSEIWLTSWHGTLSHYLQGFSNIPGGCWGFLNHQQYYRKSYSITAWNPKQQFVNGCFSWMSPIFFLQKILGNHHFHPSIFQKLLASLASFRRIYTPGSTNIAGWKMDPLIESMYFLWDKWGFLPAIAMWPFTRG